MKKQIFVFVILALTFFVVASAQSPEPEMVTIRKDVLTPEQLSKIKAEATSSQLTQYKEWAEMGRGIGVAVRDSLSAVKDVAVDFSKTDVGKFTIFLVAWKVMAKDIVSMGDMVIGYIIGPILLAIGGAVLIWSYRRQCMTRRVLIEEGKDGKKWVILAPGGEKIDLGEKGDPYLVSIKSAWAVGHFLAMLLLIIISSMMIFSGN